jgi:hypothetical protein
VRPWRRRTAGDRGLTARRRGGPETGGSFADTRDMLLPGHVTEVDGRAEAARDGHSFKQGRWALNGV